jgi:crotonobetainyl-CoA:carnitine CoA-transferase CaiB-like acyl-CoA transferase
MEVLQGGDGEPQQVAGAPLDYGNAFLAAAAILMALHRRALTGAGEHVECPQLAAGLFATSDVFESPAGVSSRPALEAAGVGYGSAYRLYAAADGWIFVCCPDEPTRRAFGELVGADAEGFFAAATVAAAPARLAEHGIPAEEARPWAGDRILEDAVLRETGRVVASDHPVLGRLLQLGGFIRFAGRAAAAARSVPVLGQHTREVLREAGFTDDEIDALRAERVVAWPDAGGG